MVETETGWEVQVQTMQRQIRTIIVDDCRDVSFLLGVTMDLDGGFDVVGEAVDARGGLALAAATRPDLVIVDLQLGRKDGMWLLARLRQTLGESAVLALVTGSDIERHADAAVANGADGVFAKAAMTTTLLDDLRHIIADRNLSEAMVG